MFSMFSSRPPENLQNATSYFERHFHDAFNTLFSHESTIDQEHVWTENPDLKQYINTVEKHFLQNVQSTQCNLNEQLKQAASIGLFSTGFDKQKIKYFMAVKIYDYYKNLLNEAKFHETIQFKNWREQPREISIDTPDDFVEPFELIQKQNTLFLTEAKAIKPEVIAALSDEELQTII